MALLVLCILVGLLCDRGTARVVHADDETVVAVVSGSLYALEPLTGELQHKLQRRDLSVLDKTGVQAMRLDLGPDIAALDMELSQDTAWTDDSQVIVRRGDQVEEVYDAVDSSCFLSGRLTSHDGAASLNRCGRLSGMIQTGDYHYEIEEGDEENLDSDLTNVKVIMRRSGDNMTSEDDGIIIDDHLLGHEGDDSDDMVNGGPTKRQSKSISAEIAVFLDSNFYNYMSRARGKKTVAAITQWMVMKWNVIRNVFGNTKKIGVPFTLKLKKVEIWKTNPSYYKQLGAREDTVKYLKTFCTKTPKSPNYDHKMLYTKNTGIENHLGMAYLNGICRHNQQCSLVKAYRDEVKIELHEFGHNVGLDHDPQLQPCSDPTGDGGFMGWGSNYHIMDCYRRHLLKRIKDADAKCLYRDDVNLPTLNPSSNAKQKSENKKKENQQKNKNNGKCN